MRQLLQLAASAILTKARPIRPGPMITGACIAPTTFAVILMVPLMNTDLAELRQEVPSSKMLPFAHARGSQSMQQEWLVISIHMPLMIS